MKNSITVTFLLAYYLVAAQPFGGIRTPNDTLKSVRVLKQNKVALSIYAPKATEVTVLGDFLKEYKPLALTKGEQGVWSVLVSDLVPDVYTYDFTVDGVKTFDPKNPQYKEGENGLSNIFELPGKESAYAAVKKCVTWKSGKGMVCFHSNK